MKMNEEEIQEALKIIKEPITVNSIEYKYFDQENYEKLLMVYENCLWFVNNAEQFMQNLKNLQEENQKLVKVIEDIDKYIHTFKIEDIGEKTMLILNDILLIKNGLGKDVVRLNKLTELKGGSND